MNRRTKLGLGGLCLVIGVFPPVAMFIDQSSFLTTYIFMSWVEMWAAWTAALLAGASIGHILNRLEDRRGDPA